MAYPEVVVAYDRADLPRAVPADVALLLRSVPQRCLAGLRMVRLAAASEFPPARRRSYTKARGHKVSIPSCLGLYHQAWHNSPASIELFVDNVYRGSPRWVLRTPFLRRLILAPVLFHELGHHVHRTISPEHTEREDVADRWSRRLGRRLLYRRYWYLMPVIYPIALAIRLLERLNRPARA